MSREQISGTLVALRSIRGRLGRHQGGPFRCSQNLGGSENFVGAPNFKHFGPQREFKDTAVVFGYSFIRIQLAVYRTYAGLIWTSRRTDFRAQTGSRGLPGPPRRPQIDPRRAPRAARETS